MTMKIRKCKAAGGAAACKAADCPEKIDKAAAKVEAQKVIDSPTADWNEKLEARKTLTDLSSTSSFTVKDVEDALAIVGKTRVAEALESWGGKKEVPSIELPGIGTAVAVDSRYGFEGGGEDIWVVFAVDGELYRLNGHYNSNDGEDWEYSTLSRVTPRSVVQVVYDEA